MAEPTDAQKFFEAAVEVIKSESEGFAGVINTLVSFDVQSSCGTELEIFKTVGSTLLTLFFCMEAFTYCASIDFNGGIEGALKVAMKLVVSQLIIQNVDNVTGIISGLFKSVACDSYSDAFSGISTAFATAATGGGDMEPGLAGINYWCMGFLLFIVVAILFVLFGLIVITMLGVVFETGMLIAIAPVALSTLVNSQARSTGISFIKNFAAVSMQWGVLTICFKVYNKVSTGLTLNFADVSGSMLANIMCFATPLLSVIMLAVMVSKASDVTKRALGG